MLPLAQCPLEYYYYYYSMSIIKVSLSRKTVHQSTLQKQEAQLMLTTGSTRLAVSRGQQTWYHSTCNI